MNNCLKPFHILLVTLTLSGFVITLSSNAADVFPQGIYLKLKEAKEKAPPEHPKISQAILKNISNIRDHVSRMPPDKVGVPIDLSVHSTPFVHVSTHGNIQVYIYVNKWGNSESKELKRLGVKVDIVNEKFGIVQAWVPYHRIDKVAGLDFIMRITAPSYGELNSGSIQTEGDAILNADDVRALGHDGGGIKVGVISFGVVGLSTAQASGDLPSVTVLQTATDDAEGTAMLEIVHDLAPGATLGFCGLPSRSSLEFMWCVSSLESTFGADIIVDDLGFFSEPYFEDGLIAKTVKLVTDSGVFYTSAAGNDAQQHYQNTFLPFPVTTLDFHDFGGSSGALSDIDVDFHIPPGATLRVDLQWSEPFGGACTDYDIALFDQFNEILAFSVDLQDCNDDPSEALVYTNTFLFTTESVFLTVFKPIGSNNREIEMFYSLTPDQYITPAGSIYGHPAIPGVMAVGAINANDPGNDNIEIFSSRGPSEIFFPSTDIRAKPDITAIDGVSVTGAGGFQTPFFGTSAAAPHIAGIAALLKSASPSASAIQISQAIKTSAIDLGGSGPDTTYGYGRIDALAALNTNSPTSPVDLNGTIKTMEGLDICAMVLVSGQFMFSCDPLGVYSFTDLPRETDGTVKRQMYADGFQPFIVNLTESGTHNIVMTAAGACPNYNDPVEPGFFPGSAGNWIDISGAVEVGENGDPVCAMVLANGQFMFSCDGAGSYALNVPLDSNGQVKLQIYADGFAPYIINIDEFQPNNTAKLARASECQAP